MKRIWLVLLGLLVFVVPVAQAQFNYVINGSAVTIVSYTGSGGAVSIPATIANLPVTAIGSNAFYQYYSVTSVTFPDSVTTIGEGAFYDCLSLNTVTFGAGLMTIGDGAFEACTELTKVSIPNSVTSIEEGAFYNCAALTSVTIGSGVTSIGLGAFDSCESLTSVTIPNSVTSIGAIAFFDCYHLGSITIPNSVTNLGAEAFEFCSALTSVTIGNGVASIETNEFDGCTSLESVSLGTGVTTIETNAFYDCTSLIGIKIPNSVTSIGINAFGDSGLINIAIPAGVTNFTGAFLNCSDLLSATISNGVTTIGNAAFYDCYNLISVTIPNSVTTIGPGAFDSCESLKSITIPGSVTSIGEQAFYECYDLASVTIPNSVTSLGDRAFAYCSTLTNATVGSGITDLGEETFYDSPYLSAVYFLGNAPTADSTDFDEDESVEIYYYAGTSGWTTTFDGIKTQELGYLPTISITSPANGSQFTLPANISITASASDLNVKGAITQVSFYANATNLLAQIDNPPFTFTWTTPPVGTNILTAVAVDNIRLTNTSTPVTVTVVAPAGPPLFSFSQAAYSVSENAGSVTLTVLNGGGLGGIVSYQTVDGTAFGRNGFSGSYTIASGSLTFANGQASSAIVITIVDNDLDAPDIQFYVQLSNPTAGTLGSPSVATVTIHLNDPGGATNSLLVTVAPSAQPAMNSQLTVETTPATVAGQWRFPWDLVWRSSGDTVTGLVAGNYPIDFNNAPNYLAFPQSLTAAVTGATIVTNTYSATVSPVSSASTGSLTVNFTGAAGGGGWQFVGGTEWQPSGSTAYLVPGTYFIQFEQVNGWSQPGSQAVQVLGGENITISESYLVSETPPSAASFPTEVPSSDITANNYPYRFNGELQTDVGFGSGVAVRENIVLTAAHMVFNDQTLAYVNQAFWDFQQEAGVFQPEPQAARGWYLLSGYASQRTYDLSHGYGPDESSPQSQDLDVAALYFLAPAARGGYGGYLASDSTPNQWLNSANQVMLVGYPVDGSIFGRVVSAGVMYATIPQTASFAQENDQVYETANFLSFPGNSGGPVYVQFTNNIWYPAAVYLGTSGSDQSSVSIMRAIDSNVVNLIDLAASEGDSGTNNSGGGVVTIVPGQGIANNPGLVEVTIEPPAAFKAGGAWKFSNLSDAFYSTANPSALAVTNTVSLQLQFKSIPGWNSPASQPVTVGAGSVTSLTATYTPSGLVIESTQRSGGTFTFSWNASPGQTFEIQVATKLAQPQWTTLSGTITATGSTASTTVSIGGITQKFYRVVLLP
jgi:hypothetical protein